jgi:hypothetical protein
MRITLMIMMFQLLWNIADGQAISFLQQLDPDTAADIHVTLDWKALERKKKEKLYVPARVNVLTPGGLTLGMDAKVKTRGHMRLSICTYPPLKLKIDKNDLADHACSDLNEMDIVHPCHNGDEYDQLLLREYLAYKIYEVITPYSFQTRLIRLHYVNSDQSEAHDPTYAFLVENEEEFVSRFGAKRYNSATISRNAIEREAYLRMSLFQFMIGNTDWHMPSRHNLDFVGIPGHPLLITIPFDFDYSGLVSAPYAAHHESIKLSSVEVRYYQGWCEPIADVEAQIKYFLEKKEEIMALPKTIEGLDAKSLEHVQSYLEDFYAILENPKKLENQVIRHCDMWPVKE